MFVSRASIGKQIKRPPQKKKKRKTNKRRARRP